MDDSYLCYASAITALAVCLEGYRYLQWKKKLRKRKWIKARRDRKVGNIFNNFILGSTSRVNSNLVKDNNLQVDNNLVADNNLKENHNLVADNNLKEDNNLVADNNLKEDNNMVADNNLKEDNNLVAEMFLNDQHFFEFHRMTKECFHEVLELVTPLIEKQDTKMRKAIPAQQRLSVTLRYLATGESRRSLESQYGISNNLISQIIPEVCRAIHTVLKDTYLKFPTSTQQWGDIACEFYRLWGFPMCLGALDGKCFLVKKPPFSGPELHHSIIMLSLVDANCRFLHVDVRSQGGGSVAGVWERCMLSWYLDENKLQFPPPTVLPSTTTQVPYVIVGDDAFPLKTYLMKPYPGKHLTADQGIFNDRLSRAKSVSENAFHILTSKFGVLQHPIAAKPTHTQHIIFAAVALHNYLRVKCGERVEPDPLEKTDIENMLLEGQLHGPPSKVNERLQTDGRSHSNDAERVRDTFRDYFTSTGRVHWLERMAPRL